MGSAASKSVQKNVAPENINLPKKNTCKSLVTAYENSAFEDDSKNKESKSLLGSLVNPPVEVGETSAVENVADKTLKNFVGKFKSKLQVIDDVVHTRTDSSFILKSSGTESSVITLIRVPQKCRKKKLRSISDTFEETLDKGESTKERSGELKKDSTAESSGTTTKVDIFVDEKGGLKLDISDSSHDTNSSRISLEGSRLVAPKSKKSEVEKSSKANVSSKDQTVDNEKKETSSNKFLQTCSRILSNFKKCEKADEVAKPDSKAELKIKSEKLETLGIRQKSQAEKLFINKNSFTIDTTETVKDGEELSKVPPKVLYNSFRKQFLGNKVDENIISIENLMSTPKECKIEKESVQSTSLEDIVLENAGLMTLDSAAKYKTTFGAPSIVYRCSHEEDKNSRLDVLDVQPTNEIYLKNNYPVHKVLIRASSSRTNKIFGKPFNFVDLMINEEIINPLISKSVSLSSYTSEATENDFSDIEEIISTTATTTSSFAKTYRFPERYNFCSSSGISCFSSKMSRRSLQRIQAITSFSVDNTKTTECFFALDRINNPSSKLIFLMEMKYKRKFKTLDELYQRPVELINFLRGGDFQDMDGCEPIQSHISHEEILNSMVSGI